MKDGKSGFFRGRAQVVGRVKQLLRASSREPAKSILPILLLVSACLAQTTDLTDLSIEDLANVKVTSVSKKAESLSGAPAAIFVLTGEDIRRGGFTTLPEALRTVPGLYVVQINPHQWQVSARGFGDLNNNKMLVLVDGRSVYTPEYGGVYWDVLDVPLEDIDRVEVIRGPGGTLWGANAMNGVINIVMKRSQQTQGAVVSTSADLDQGYTALVQYGGQIGQSLSYRIFTKSSYWEPYNSSSGEELPNNFNMSQAGFRADWTPSSRNSVSLETETYDGRFRNTEIFSAARTTDLLKGSDVLIRWKHTISSRSNTDLLAYCDWYTRTGVPAEMRNTCNVEFQHNYSFTSRQSLIWGGSFLSTGDDLTQDPATYTPEKRRNRVVGGFAQYDVAIVPDRFRLLAGTKLEHNDYTGFEYQPQVRAVWTPNKIYTLWASVSRAIRSPVRNESNLQLLIPSGISNGELVFVDITGNPNLKSEHLRAYELGYRYQPNQALSFRAAAYYNDYSNLIVTANPTSQFTPTELLLKTPYINDGAAQTHGIELTVSWNPFKRWTLSTGVTELRGSPRAAESTPRHLFNVQSRFNLPHNMALNSGLYHYGALPIQATLATGSPAMGIPAFNRVDVGLSWQATSQWSLAVWGRNLQSSAHVESLATAFDGLGAEIPRSVSFKITWQQKGEAPRK